MLERASEKSGDKFVNIRGMVLFWSAREPVKLASGATRTCRSSRGGISMEEHGKLWAIATLLFVIAIIGYVLQA